MIPLLLSMMTWLVPTTALTCRVMTSPAELPVLWVSVLCILWLAPKLSVENELLKTRTLGRWHIVCVTDSCRPRLLDMPELFRVTVVVHLLLTCVMNLSVRVMLVVVPMCLTCLVGRLVLRVVPLVVSSVALCPWLEVAESLATLILVGLFGRLLQSMPEVMAFPNSMDRRGMQLTPLCRAPRLQLCMLMLLISIRFLSMLQKCGMRPTSDDPLELADLTNVMARFRAVAKSTFLSTVLCELGQAKLMPWNLMALCRLAPVMLVVAPALPLMTGLALSILTTCRVEMLVCG